MKLGWMAAAALALLGAGCESPTQLVVVVDTDLEPGVEVDVIEVSASVAGSVGASHSFELPETELPFSFGVSPIQGVDGPVSLRVSARDAEGRTVIGFDGLVPFVPGEVATFEVPLARSCLLLSTECGEDRTCLNGECRSRLIDQDELARGGADEPEPLFDGPRQAPDAGPADAGGVCQDGAECFVMEGNPCVVGRTICDGDVPVCEEADRLAAGTPCGMGRVCDGEGRCGAPAP